MSMSWANNYLLWKRDENECIPFLSAYNMQAKKLWIGCGIEVNFKGEKNPPTPHDVINHINRTKIVIMEKIYSTSLLCHIRHRCYSQRELFPNYMTPYIVIVTIDNGISDGVAVNVHAKSQGQWQGRSVDLAYNKRLVGHQVLEHCHRETVHQSRLRSLPSGRHSESSNL